MFKYSFIVPVYNDEKYLERCVKSLLNQTYKNFEVILIDDGSTDSSYSIMENIKAFSKDVDIFIYKQNNQGIGQTRNIGLSYATGDYIWFIDNDDWIFSKSLELIDFFLKQNDVDILEIGFINPKQYIGDKAFCNTNLKLEKISQSDAIINEVDYPWSKILSRKFLTTVNMNFPSIFGEDTAEVNRWYAFTDRIYKLKGSTLYAWYRNKNSFSHKVLTSFHMKTSLELLDILLTYSENYEGLKDDYLYVVYRLSKRLIYGFSFKKNNDRELNNLRLETIDLINEKVKNIDNIYVKIDKSIRAEYMYSLQGKIISGYNRAKDSLKQLLLYLRK